jgi:dUTP pyrophosphatase
MEMNIMLAPGAVMPEYGTTSSAGMDLRSNAKEPVVIPPFGAAKIPTGVFFEIPDGVEGDIRSRSGLFYNKGLFVTGTIDADYRGEVFANCRNISNEEIVVMPCERICQIVFSKFEDAILTVATKLSETVRGDGGFGHTGNL